MDHLEVLREKITSLRREIAELQELNEQYRRSRPGDAQAHFAHGQRQGRLLEIQAELTQLARLSGRVGFVEHLKEQQRFRQYLVKKAS